MRSIQDINMISPRGQKFQCPRSESNLFTIYTLHQVFTVDKYGKVLDPPGMELDYTHEDSIHCETCHLSSTVRNFLTVDSSLDSPRSQPW